MAKHDNLKNAKEAKNDEFYTQLSDIEAEISQHKDYVKQFEDKVVLCNCDDPEMSNFFVFFKLHFKQLKLKKLITTHYNKDGKPSYKLEWAGEMLNDDMVNLVKTPLIGNGDFRSEECIEILKEADIVVTNPPFSLFREYVAQLVEFKKKFIIVGNMNAITYRDFFPLLKEGKVRAGYDFNKTWEFIMPNSYKLKGKAFVDENGKKHGFVPAICWYTNMDLDKHHEPLILTKNYTGNEDKYPKYANYDAIDCGKVKDIPKDYTKAIGVPITYLSVHCADQFEIIGLGISNSGLEVGVKPYLPEHKKYRKEVQKRGAVDGDLYMIDNDNHPVVPYARILIKRKEKKDNEG